MRPTLPDSRRSSRHGFTLVELLTVLAVIGILSAVALGAMRGVKERAKVVRARAELAAIAAALEEFKRVHGDYPQTGEFPQAPATPDAPGVGPGVQTAQAKLFNCLTGVFGARLFAPEHRRNGPGFLELARFSIDGTRRDAAGAEQDMCLLDPWGRRYLYYYRSARTPAAWQAAGYVLYSAGPTVAADGTQTPPIVEETGLMRNLPTPEVADNVYANR